MFAAAVVWSTPAPRRATEDGGRRSSDALDEDPLAGRRRAGTVAPSTAGGRSPAAAVEQQPARRATLLRAVALASWSRRPPGPSSAASRGSGRRNAARPPSSSGSRSRRRTTALLEIITVGAGVAQPNGSKRLPRQPRCSRCSRRARSAPSPSARVADRSRRARADEHFLPPSEPDLGRPDGAGSRPVRSTCHPAASRRRGRSRVPHHGRAAHDASRGIATTRTTRTSAADPSCRAQRALLTSEALQSRGDMFLTSGATSLSGVQPRRLERIEPLLCSGFVVSRGRKLTAW